MLLLLGCAGCGFLVLLAGVGGTMGYLLLRDSRPARHTFPAAWRDSLRAAYRLPDVVGRLALPAADSGNADSLLRAARTPRGVEATLRARAARRTQDGAGLVAEDSALIRSSLHDSLAALAARAARMPRLDPPPPAAGTPPLMPPLGDGIRSSAAVLSRAVDAVILRGEARRWRGDRAGARADFAAAIALGRLALQDEASALGPGIGRRAMRGGAAGMARLARASRDTALDADAAELARWAATDPRGVFRFGPPPPDTLVVMAQDSALPRGVRISALEMTCYSALYQPFWRLLTGPSGALMSAVRALGRDADPVVARAAVMADSTLRRMDAMGVANRFRLASGRPLR